MCYILSRLFAVTVHSDAFRTGFLLEKQEGKAYYFTDINTTARIGRKVDSGLPRDGQQNAPDP